MRKINPIIQWWVTPKLPYHDIFELPLLIEKNKFKVFIHLISHWFIHPIKRRVAKRYLEFLQKYTDIKIIAVTGSAGKTTVTEMLGAIFSLVGKTVWSKESIDPVYNIPNTILRATPYTKYLILEMGVEYPGEMDFYLWLAKPEVGVITNIFPTHLEFLGNIEGVLKEKSKLLFSLSNNGTAVLNSGDNRLRDIAKKIKAKIIWFDTNEDLAVQNSIIATAVAKNLGVNSQKINQGLKDYCRPKHRLSVVNLKSGATLLDDSYNSNPEASLSTLKFFEKMARGKRKIAVLGEMKELGDFEKEGHRKVGKKVAEMGFDVVIGVGNAAKYFLEEVTNGSKKTKTVLVANSDQVVSILRPLLTSKTVVLIKGSRSIGLDKVVSVL